MSILKAIIEAYLRGQGFTSYLWKPEGGSTTELWGHPVLGQGRTFNDALSWCIGCELAGRDLRVESLDTREVA